MLLTIFPYEQALTTLENIISRLRDLDEGRLTPPSTPQRLPRSSPASPAASKKNKRYQSSSPIRNILNSPLLNRRQRKKQNIIDSSDDEANGTNGSGEENAYSNNNGCSKQYRDLETFQKAQLRQKVGIHISENYNKWITNLCFSCAIVKTWTNRTEWILKL